jgi:hypothetical protein
MLLATALKGVLPALGAHQAASYALASKISAAAGASRGYSAASSPLTDGKPKTILAVLYSVRTRAQQRD